MQIYKVYRWHRVNFAHIYLQTDVRSRCKKEESLVAKPSSFMLIEYFCYSFGALSINSMNWSSFGVMII